MTAKWRIAEIITEERPSPFWQMLRQLGVDEVVGRLPRAFNDWRRSPGEDPWDFYPLARYKKMIEEEGLQLSAIEDNPPMDALRCGTEERAQELEYVCRMIENMGKLKIGIWCYNWMAYLGWMRTSSRLRGRGGAIVSGYDDELSKSSPPHPKGPVAAETLWKNLDSFLKDVIPVAKNAGVKLAMHPDDPPLPSIRGISRIINSVASYDRLLEIYPSEFNGITFCQGNFVLMTDDVPTAIRHFGKTGKIFFVHFRDVRGNASKFEEIFLDEGRTNMVECVKAYREIGFDGIMRCDHTPTLEGDEAEVPGYSVLGRLHAIGYMTGVRQAVYSEN
jgi:mannonate dehydratase